MTYPDLPIRPQIVRDAPLVTFHLAANPERLARCVPRPLQLHPKARLDLNMWVLDDAASSTGFGGAGPLGVAYLAAEVAGDEGQVTDGPGRYPARCWLRHWNSSAAARQYAHQASGMVLEPAAIHLEKHGDRLTFTLALDGREAIRASATVAPTMTGRQAACSLYYPERQGPAGGREVARYEISSIADAYPASDASVFIDLDPADPASAFLDARQQVVDAVAFRRMTLVPYIATGTVPVG